MWLVWVVIPLVFLGIVGIQDVFSEQTQIKISGELNPYNNIEKVYVYDIEVLGEIQNKGLLEVAFHIINEPSGFFKLTQINDDNPRAEVSWQFNIFNDKDSQRVLKIRNGNVTESIIISPTPFIITESDLEYAKGNIADFIRNIPKFEKFSSPILDTIRAGEIDEYKIVLVISKAPQDVGSFGSNHNVAKLRDIIENEMGLEILGSGSADITLFAPIETLPEFVKYPYVERIIGYDFGIKYDNENKTQGTIKLSYKDKMYDVLYNSTNAIITGYKEFGINFASLENTSTMDVTYPRELTDTIKTVVTTSMLPPPYLPFGYVNVTMTSLLTNEEKIESQNYKILEINEEYIKIQLNNYDEPRGGGILLYGAPVAGHSYLDNNIDESSDILPKWIKGNIGWWENDQVNEDTFMMVTKFLIENKFINTDGISENTKSNLENKAIPEWFKNNVRWWTSNQIDDETFVQGIEFLVKEGIIQVS